MTHEDILKTIKRWAQEAGDAGKHEVNHAYNTVYIMLEEQFKLLDTSHHEPEPELVRCEMCEDGIWFTECCNGAGGCDCRGERVEMGRCNVCNGSGWRHPDADKNANSHTIKGRCFAGSGPKSGYWAG